MQFHAVYTPAAVALALVALVAAPPVTAQDADAEETLARFTFAYHHRDQAAAADGLVAQLGRAAEDPVVLYELSRLLSEPCDQVRWLNTQIERHSPFSATPEMQAAAQTVLTQLTELEQAERAALAGCTDQLAALKQQLQEIAQPSKPVWEITDPTELVGRWRMLDDTEKNELNGQLTADQKLALFSRGIPASELDLNQGNAWDQPRRIVDELARSEVLPPVWQLLQLERQLRAEWEKGPWSELAFPVDGTFQITRELLDRALGVDARDRGAPASSPNWGEMATWLESQEYWAWAALARMLQASNQEDPAEAASRAEAQWGKLTQVNSALSGALWPAIAQVEQAWLKRLLDRSKAGGPRMLPLGPDYRSASREDRLRLEEQFLRAQNDPEEAFRIIQLAKAADLGMQEFQPVELAELENSFKLPIKQEVALRVFLLLEMIEIHGKPGEPSQYYAVRLHAKESRWMAGGYDATVIGPFSTPAQLLQAALDSRVDLTDLRILIAPDGPLDDEWFAYEKDRLLKRTGDRAQGWLCYLPSAAVMNGGSWTLEHTLRVWYRLALRAGQETAGWYPDGKQPWAIGSTLFRLPRMPLYALSLGPLPEEIGDLGRSRSFVAEFKEIKEAGSATQQLPLPAMLVLTGEGL
jgi:hypothetical protein